MPDKKLTDNEIIKALECHASDAEVCKLCPLTNEEWCSVKLARKTLDLINRQKAEVEALIAGQETLQKYIAEKNAEIKRLKYNLKSVLDERADHSEAVKEFAERLKKKTYSYTWQNELEGIPKTAIYQFTNDVLDNLVKKMVGEE